MQRLIGSFGIRIPFFWLLVLAITPLPAGATIYFVATNGWDGNPGTNLAAPFLTVRHAAARVVAGDTCFIRTGVYYQTLAPTDSGTVGAPITFAAFSNDVVTLDAADMVTGWTALSNGIYQASVNWSLGQGSDQVFVDGTMVHQAQLPAYGSGDVLHPGTAALVVSSTNTALITCSAWNGKPDNYWAGAWFSGGVGLSWAWQSARVLSSTGATITVDSTTETPNWWFTGNGAGFLFGQLNLLNTDNQWDLETNGNSNTLSLRITGGANPSAHTVEMKHRDWCVDLNGHNYIIVSNLNLWAGAVRLTGNGNVLQNCRAQYLSHFMIISQGYLENGGSEQGDGVEVNGNNTTVWGCTLANTAGSGVYTSGNSNVISRNLIYNTDYSGGYGCCLALHGNQEVVTFNTAHSSGRDILRPEGTGSQIRFNDLSNPGLLSKDLGVIYVWGVNAQATNGPATRIAYNWLHDNDYPVPAPLVYLDNYDANFVVDHNVIWNTGGDAGIRINAPALGHLLYNNTLFNCANAGAYTYDSWPGGNPNPAFWTNDVDQYSASNNLYLANAPQSQLLNWTNEIFTLKANAPTIDAGVVIPGYTDGYLGRAPDLGALESGALPWTAGTGSRPSLVVTNCGGGNLTLLASPDAAYCRLYTTTDLSPPASWSPVTNLPYVSDYQWSVTLTTSASVATFYRLQAQ